MRQYISRRCAAPDAWLRLAIIGSAGPWLTPTLDGSAEAVRLVRHDPVDAEVQQLTQGALVIDGPDNHMQPRLGWTRGVDCIAPPDLAGEEIS